MAYFKTLFVSLFTLLTCSCDSGLAPDNENTMTTPFYIKAGISPAQYNQRNNLQQQTYVDRQPAGLNFYKKKWNVNAKGKVHVDNELFSFTINHVLGLTGTESRKHPQMGIKVFTVRSGITATEFINHDQARILFMQLLQRVLDVGWQSYVEFVSAPRLLGKESIIYAIKDEIYAPDPRYIPSLDEWMALDTSHTWVFHANDVFLNISFRRNSQFLDKNGDGVYLLTFEVMTKEERAKLLMSSSEREQWKELWEQKIKKNKLNRYKKEVELIKQGYHINTDYIEPLIHPADPVEPDSDEAKALLEYIRLHNN